MAPCASHIAPRCSQVLSFATSWRIAAHRNVCKSRRIAHRQFWRGRYVFAASPRLCARGGGLETRAALGTKCVPTQRRKVPKHRVSKYSSALETPRGRLEPMSSTIKRRSHKFFAQQGGNETTPPFALGSNGSRVQSMRAPNADGPSRRALPRICSRECEHAAGDRFDYLRWNCECWVSAARAAIWANSS